MRYHLTCLLCRSMVLTIPQGLMSAFICLGTFFVTSRYKNVIGITAIFCQSMVLLGAILLWALPPTNKNGLFAGIYLMVCCGWTVLSSAKLTKTVSPSSSALLPAFLGWRQRTYPDIPRKLSPLLGWSWQERAQMQGVQSSSCRPRHLAM